MNFFLRQLSYCCLRGVPIVFHCRSFAQAQEALADYLHATRSLPFTQANQINTKSPSSLSALLSKCKFSSPNVAPIIHRFLHYHPINEFDFFFESIGFLPSEIPTFLPNASSFPTKPTSSLLRKFSSNMASLGTNSAGFTRRRLPSSPRIPQL